MQSDIQSIFLGLSNPLVVSWYGISYQTLAETQAQIDWYRAIVEQESGIWWAICDPQKPEELFGTCGFYERDKDSRNTDMGYWLHPEYWGKGIMHESLACILEYAFYSMNMHRVEAEVEPGNLASIHLLRKLGFSLEGRRRECEWKGDHFIDFNYYSLLEGELIR